MKMMISGRYYHKNDYISDLIKILFDDSIIDKLGIAIIFSDVLVDMFRRDQ